MSSSLLTVEEVADLLKISPRAVYKYRQRLGGFYPFGIRVLRFRREEIYAHLERGRKLEIPVPVAGEKIFPARIQNQGIGQGGNGEAKGATHGCRGANDSDRHGLFRIGQ
jgi:predicted transcriptional regulator